VTREIKENARSPAAMRGMCLVGDLELGRAEEVVLASRNRPVMPK
jgi:hypothetical protein